MTEMALPGPLIVVGVDGSDRSQPVLRWAADYARATNGRVRAVMAWQPTQLANLFPFRVEADLVATAQRRLHKLVATWVKGVPVETAVLEGSPARVLTGAAENADLLVIGGDADGRDPSHASVVLQ